MPQSLASILVHVIFSTKDRRRLIVPGVEGEMWKYLGGTCGKVGCPSQRVGGDEDHVHILCTLGRTISIAKLVEEIKTGSSKWIKSKGPEFSSFAWQSGYGAFSVGQSQPPQVIDYIDRQKEHHLRRTFQDEFRAFLKKYDVLMMSDTCGIEARPGKAISPRWGSAIRGGGTQGVAHFARCALGWRISPRWG